eukprot:4970519-Prymnesium_polylepis.1
MHDRHVGHEPARDARARRDPPVRGQPRRKQRHSLVARVAGGPSCAAVAVACVARPVRAAARRHSPAESARRGVEIVCVE